jgi:hypothetical protein
MQTITKTPTLTRVVPGVITHYRAHGDEYATRAIADTFGTNALPGIRQAPWIFWGKRGTPDGRPVKDWENDLYVLLGIEKSRFDEHNASGQTTQSCAARLMAEFLGVEKYACLRELLVYTTRADREKIQDPFGLFATLKDINLFYPEDQQDRVAYWASRAFNAHIQGQQELFNDPTPYLQRKKAAVTLDVAVANYICLYHEPYCERDLTLESAIQLFTATRLPQDQVVQWLKLKYPQLRARKQNKYASLLLAQHLGIMDHPYFKNILAYVANSESFRNKASKYADVFELENVTQEMCSCEGPFEALEWASAAIGAKVYSAFLFDQAREEYKKASQEGIPTKNYGELLLTTLESNNFKISPYSRSKEVERKGWRPDIIVQARSSGHICVFTNQNINLDPAMAEISAQERAQGGDPDKIWFHFKGDGNDSIFNGSLSYPFDPRTNLRTQVVSSSIKKSLR